MNFSLIPFVYIHDKRAVVGMIAGIISSSFQRKLLNDLGTSSLPDDPRERYKLITEKCHYVRTWTNLDSFSLAIFLLGASLMIGSVILAIIETGTGQVLYIDKMPVLFGVILLGTIFTIVSTGMLLSRFTFLIRILQKDTRNASLPHWLVQPPVPITRYGIGILAILYAGTSILVAENYGIGNLLIETVIFVILMAGLLIREVMRRKKI